MLKIYIYRAYIANGEYFINFADSSPKGYPRAGIVYQYGQQIADRNLMEFGAFQLAQIKYGEEPEITTLGPVLKNLFSLGDWQKMIKEPLIGEYYFPDLQVAVGRDKKDSTQGFFMAAKGGHNEEEHNHNDVGSCIIFFDGQPVLIDVGVGTYTKQTFSEDRYRIWTMQSNYHNLPLINGVAQSPGREFKAQNSKFSANRSTVSFSTDISKAYPKEAKAEQWTRSYTLERGKKIRIMDDFRLKEVIGKSELHFLTPLGYDINTPGIIKLKSADFNIEMKYDKEILSARVDNKSIDDKKLTNVWGNNLNIIVLEIKETIAGKIKIDITGK